MITHDLGVIAEIADDVVVMYAARVAERGTVDEIFKEPRHPYTWGLFGSLPRLDRDVERLVQIVGQPPSLLMPPPGCRFHPRCPHAMPQCAVDGAAELKGAPKSPRPPRRVPARRGGQGARGCPAAGRFDGGGAMVMAEDLLVVENLEKHFPITRGLFFQREVATVKAVDDVSFTRQEGRDARSRGRVRLRQVDDGALHHAPARADRRARSSSRARTSRISSGGPCARSGAR